MVPCYYRRMNAVTLPEMQYRAWLRVEDFVMLHESGAFADHGKTELIEGEILKMNAQFVRHAFAKSLLHLAIDRALRAIASPLVTMVEASVAMPPFDMPEPDIVVTALPSRGGPLSINGVALIVEVADTTQRYDLGRKAFVYARNRVPEYWVANLGDNVIVRHWNPGVAGYDATDQVAFGSPVASLTIDGLTIATDDLTALPGKD